MMSVRSSTFSGNSAGDGGGISNFGNDSVVSNSTFSGNSVTPIYPWSDGRGAGIHNADFTLTIRNSTFSGNSASVDRGAGIYSGQYGTTTIKNTIIANNWPGANCAGTVTDGSGNLSYPDDTCPGINLNPRLYPLQDNGGPTETMALGPGSGALDAGDDATCAADPINNHDQRGHLRPKGPRCDIGAIEQEPYPKTWFPFASRR
jgi:predicted outer membrane repeat protein